MWPGHAKSLFSFKCILDHKWRLIYEFYTNGFHLSFAFVHYHSLRQSFVRLQLAVASLMWSRHLTNALLVYIMVTISYACETLSLLVLGCLHRCSERTWHWLQAEGSGVWVEHASVFIRKLQESWRVAPQRSRDFWYRVLDGRQFDDTRLVA